jgi:cytidyltransferase-like protein
MKTFSQLVSESKEKENHGVMAFGRMNPPTTGHMKLVDKVKSVAKKVGAKHVVVVSHSQDSKKNPLSAEQKIHHLKRYSPDTNFKASSTEHPTIIHQAAQLHKQGVTHLHVVSGSDRVKEYHHLLHKYNGVKGAHGYYNFKSITVHSAGHRDPDAEGTKGMSASKMREHAKNKDFSSFRQGVPSHVSDEHARELMHDVRHGMGLHESVNRGLNKAIFVTGGPGSGKDIILRECLSQENIVEFSFSQIFDILADKHKLAMNSMKREYRNDYKIEAIKEHAPLIINGPADDIGRITYIKEELEELGYETMMVFVDTSEEVSKQRNNLLSKMMVESVRHEKWVKAQNNIATYDQLFENFVIFDNNDNKDFVKDNLDSILSETTHFFDNIRETVVGNYFLHLHESKQNAKEIQKSNLSSKGYPAQKLLKNNNAPYFQIQRKMGKKDDVRDGDVAPNSTYIFRTYSESKFQMDADKERRMKRGDRSLTGARVGSVDGVSPTFDTRGTTAAAGAGLGGDVTYKEETSRGGTREFSNDDVADFSAKSGGPKPNPLAEKKKTLKKFKEAIDDPGSTDMGVGGTLGGSTNKEPLQTPMDRYGMAGITIKKKKTGAK